MAALAHLPTFHTGEGLTVVLQFDPACAVIPLSCYWAKLPEEGRPTLETLQELARAGNFKGTFQPPKSKIWMINLLALMQEGLESDDAQETKATRPAPKGDGLIDPPREPLVRKDKKERGGATDGGIRHRRKGGQGT